MVAIVEAEGGAQLDRVRALFRAYAREFGPAIEPTLDVQGFEAEVAALPGKYARPSGRLLMAVDQGRPAGCVAMRPLGDGDVEMKRLYVAPESRGSGLGRRLVEAIVAEARAAGYARICLDSLPVMARAIALYRDCGFVEVPPYWPSPVETVYMARELRPPDGD